MLLVLGLATAQMIVFVIVTYAVARAFGLAPRAIAIGTPPVVRVRRASPEIRIGPIPMASVELAGDRVEQGQRVIYMYLSRPKRIAIALAPWLVVLAAASACIGVEPALRSFARGFEQIVFTLDLTPLVRRLIAIADDTPMIAAGILFAKLAAMNLVPFGGSAGGALVMQLATPPGRDTPKLVMRYVIVSMIAWMLWTLGRLVYVVVQLVGG